ncbi:hypothetical protein FAVG1_04577 [Fusarium avenaceum]|nr:hypothetical protein FAVG1_04577 [Fusarium avenaceum]
MTRSSSEDGSSFTSRSSMGDELKPMPIETYSPGSPLRAYAPRNLNLNINKKWLILIFSAIGFVFCMTFASIYGRDYDEVKEEEIIATPEWADVRNLSTYTEEKTCGKRDEVANMTIWNDVVNKTSDLVEDMFTIAIQTYQRPKQLNKTIAHLTAHKVPSLYEIVIVWNEVDVEPPADYMTEHGVLVRYRRSEKNSLNQKFLPDPRYRTQGILLSDDDWNYKAPDDIEYVFQQWRRAGMNRLTGAFARCYGRNNVTGFPNYRVRCDRHDSYSMILTGMAFTHISFLEYYHSEDELMTSVRELVDEMFNCEDIALNFVQSMLTYTSRDIDSTGLTIQKNHDGWVNPEDLMPMPQCIAQQDQSAWLNAMTKCTHHRCTSHFGVICTHYQWLTELSCLSVEFSPKTIERYVSYCSRSVLAKAQLYHWIQQVTGRTWLVHVGDTNGLQNLWPSSLALGYGTIHNFDKAPVCLKTSLSSGSKESFQHVVGSCSFTSTTLHTGNAGRPWEYSTSRKSMVALSFDTVGYDLTKWYIPPGQYFDKSCLCSTFAIDHQHGPCATSNQLELTKELLWLRVTCGLAYLPADWDKSLKVVGSSYIPVRDWYLPNPITNFPEEIVDFTQQCTTDTCKVDSDGYCRVVSTIDRQCFCHKANYDVCQGPCQTLQNRKLYVEWLHDLCGDTKDWHGLPDDWPALFVPNFHDMIPWDWTVKPRFTRQPGNCPSNLQKLGSIALVNVATLVAVLLGTRTSHRELTRDPMLESSSPPWMLAGCILASIQLLGVYASASVVQNTPGYEQVPTLQLFLLWCTLPRISWLTIFSSGVVPPSVKHLGSATSALFAELIIQGFALFYMVMTVNYGRENNFYLGGLALAEGEIFAYSMYAGAFFWLLVVAAMSIPLIRTMHRVVSPYQRLEGFDGLKCNADKNDESGIRESLLRSAGLADRAGQGCNYGAIPVVDECNQTQPRPLMLLYVIMSMGLPLLWLAQWLFWIGYIGVSMEEFCLPSLDTLTFVWIATSVGSVVVRSYL